MYHELRVLLMRLPGAGTGGATKSILESIGNTMSSYTYTDVSVGFFDKAAEVFRAYRDRMVFKVLDVERAPATQGFKPHSYDVVVASNVLHATASLKRTLENTRQLLKPGEYLMLLEVTSNGPIRFSNIMGGLPGWWLGVNDDRKYAPTITPSEWHIALRKAGFSGSKPSPPKSTSYSGHSLLLRPRPSMIECIFCDDRCRIPRSRPRPRSTLKASLS